MFALMLSCFKTTMQFSSSTKMELSHSPCSFLQLKIPGHNTTDKHKKILKGKEEKAQKLETSGPGNNMELCPWVFVLLVYFRHVAEEINNLVMPMGAAQKFANKSLFFLARELGKKPNKRENF